MLIYSFHPFGGLSVPLLPKNCILGNFGGQNGGFTAPECYYFHIFDRFGPKALSDIIQGGFEPKTRNTDKNWGLQDQNLIFGFSALV